MGADIYQRNVYRSTSYTLGDKMTRDEFTKYLPHGSGFDCGWQHIKTQKNGSEVFESHYHNMNQNGYYDGYTKMRLTIPQKINDFRLTLSGGKQKYMDYATRDYMIDTIYEALKGIKVFTFTE